MARVFAADRRLDRGEVELEGPRSVQTIARDAAVVVDVEAVLDEVRGEDDHLVARVRAGSSATTLRAPPAPTVITT